MARKRIDTRRKADSGDTVGESNHRDTGKGYWRKQYARKTRRDADEVCRAIVKGEIDPLDVYTIEDDNAALAHSLASAWWG